MYMTENVANTLNASSRILYLEAQERGISCTVFGDHETILMEKDGKSWYTRGSRTSLQSSVGKSIADKKPLAKSILTFFGLPTAKGITVRKETELEQLNDFRFPVVMKPTDGGHGKGVVVGVKNFDEAKRLFLEAQQTVLFEEMLKGIEYRIVCVNFKFIAAAFRKPAHVIGNGKNTIQELIDEKNKHPWRGEGHHNNLSLIKVDQLVENYLAEQELTVDSVPEEGREVFLRKTANPIRSPQKIESYLKRSQKSVT
jgi:cyanophycin synthetase